MGLILFLALAGVIFISLELILPGMIMGIAGTAALIASLVMTFTTEDLVGLSMVGRSLVATGILLVSLGLIALWLKNFDKTGPGKKLILNPAIDHRLGHPHADELLHAAGTAKTDLRPTGKASIEGQEKAVDVVAETGLIEAGTTVRVIKVEGSRIVVRAVPTT